jgi:hypothetical protein
MKGQTQNEMKIETRNELDELLKNGCQVHGCKREHEKASELYLCASCHENGGVDVATTLKAFSYSNATFAKNTSRQLQWQRDDALGSNGSKLSISGRQSSGVGRELVNAKPLTTTTTRERE